MRVVKALVVGVGIIVWSLVLAQPALAQSAPADRPASPRVEAGLVFNALSTVNPGSVGGFAGGGVDVAPLHTKQIAFEADAGYFRYRGGNNLTLSGNVLVYFTPAGTRPYVGGGLVHTHTHVNYTSGGTANSLTVSDTNWELAGGVTRPLAHSTKVIRAEVRAIFRPKSIFLGGTTATILVLGGINF